MTSPKAHQHAFRDTVVTLAAVGVILALLRSSASIVEPVFLSLLIVAVVSPGLKALRNFGFSTGLSVIVGLVVVMASLGVFSILLSGEFTQFADELPEYQKLLVERSANLDVWFERHGMDLHKGGVLHHFSPERVAVLVETAITHLGAALSDALLIFFIVIFMLAEANHFPHKIGSVLGTGGPVARAMVEYLNDVKLYLSTKAVVSAATGFLIWAGLKCLRIEHAELWGALALALNFIPNIGSILAAIPAVMLAMLHGSPLYVGAVAGLYLVTNVIIGNVLEPILVGRRIGLSAVTVLLSLVFWGWMFGIVGMLVSTPLSMAVKAFANGYPPTRWLAILMGPVPEGVSEEVGSGG